MPTVVSDLRSLDKCRIQADPSPGMGIFADGGRFWFGSWIWYPGGADDVPHWGAPVSVAGYVDLGSDPLARMGLAARNALADGLGINRALMRDTNLADLLAHDILGTLADPTGATRVKPLVMTRAGIVIDLGLGFGKIQTDRFSTAHPNYDAMLAVRWADYRRNAVSGVPQEVLERWTGWDMVSFRGRIDTSFLAEFVPPEYLDGRLGTHSVRPPATTLGDTFNRADNTDLNALNTGKTKDGGAGTWSWTEVSGDQAVSSNALKPPSGSAVFNSARCEEALSSANHFSQIIVTVWQGSTNAYAGPCVRFAAAAETFYHALAQRNTNDLAIDKVVTGTATRLVTSATNASLPDTLKLEISGSNLELFESGASRATVTDTVITGNLLVGCSSWKANTMDTWTAEDLAAATTTFRPRVMVF